MRFFFNNKKLNYSPPQELFNEYKFSLKKTKFISRINFCYSCDFNIETDKTYETNRKNLIKFIKENSRNQKILKININPLYFKLFSELINNITFNYILVNSNPIKVSSECPGLMKILDDNNCLKLFSTNLNNLHHKCVPIPLGLDYHCAWLDRNDWGAEYIFPIHQEYELLDVIKNKSKPISERYKLICCDYHHRIDRGDREKCFKETPKLLCYYIQKRLPRKQFWEEMIKYAFVISPTGIGDDCFRTWEAIILGCIPIVKRNYLSSMYENFPIIIVDEYSSITENLLIEQLSILQEKKFPYYKLLNNHWNSIINNDKFNAPIEELSINNFQNYLFNMSNIENNLDFNNNKNCN